MPKLLLVLHSPFGLPLRHACAQVRLQDIHKDYSTLLLIPKRTHFDKSILNRREVLMFPHCINFVCTGFSKAPGKTIPITASYPAV